MNKRNGFIKIMSMAAALSAPLVPPLSREHPVAPAQPITMPSRMMEGSLRRERRML